MLLKKLLNGRKYNVYPVGRVVYFPAQMHTGSHPAASRRDLRRPGVREDLLQDADRLELPETVLATV